MNRETIKSLIDFIPENDIDTIYKVIVKFVPEDVAAEDEIKAIEAAKKDMSDTIAHEEICWK